MISAQIDKLRLIADKDTVPYEASDAMYQAADTIWELRDDLQRANAAVQDAEHDESVAWDRVRKAEAENAKLRELCVSLYEFAMIEYPDGTELNFADRMRELGIEVD